MNAIIFKVCSRIQRVCSSPQAHHLRCLITSPGSRSSVKLLVGLVPVVPSVTVKGELKNEEKKNLDKPQTENKLDGEKVDVSKIDEIEEKNLGWERLCAMYSVDEFGNLSKEITATLQSVYFACFMGMVYGGTKQSRVAYQDFMDRNQATIFENHIDAKRRLQNHVTIHFGKGAWRWAWKLSLFTGAFVLFLTSAATYRGHYSLIDYTLSGMVIGGLFRFRLGPAGCVAGALTGGILGLVCGMSTKGILTFYDSNLDEVIAFQYELDQSRYNLYRDSLKKEYEQSPENKDVMNLLKSHDSTNKDKKFENDEL